MIKKIVKDRLTKNEIPPELSTQEAIEVLDLQGRVFRDNRSSDFSPDLMFTQYLEQMAILSREEGMDLPGNDVLLDQYVEKMKVFFSGSSMNELPGCEPVSAATAIDVDFFLSMRLGLLRLTLKHVFSLISNIQ